MFPLEKGSPFNFSQALKAEALLQTGISWAYQEGISGIRSETVPVRVLEIQANLSVCAL